MMENVVLVDENDQQIGVMEKIEAHKKGLLHRAVSVIILNSKNEMLLQQRARTKYHSPLLWANACCSHPKENETYISAAQRRLVEEMGINCRLDKLFNFIYKENVGDGLIENELDYVFLGRYEGKVEPNRNEVENYHWMSIADVEKDLKTMPKNYAAWFPHIMNHFIQSYYAHRYSS